MGGIEIFARDLSEFLIRSGASVSLAYWRIRGHSPILDEIQSNGCTMIESPITRGVSYDLPDRALSMRMRSSIRQFDLVIFLKLFSDRVMNSFLSRMESATPARIPSLYIPSFCPEEDETYRDRPKPDSGVLNRIDAIMGQCSAMSCQIESFLGYRGRSWNLPLLSSIKVSSPSPLPALAADRPTLRASFIGRLSAQKNVSALLDAYKMYLEEHEPKLRYCMDLHIHGDGVESDALRRHACVLNHADRIHFHGAYRSAELPLIAANSHFFVQTTRFEGQCLAALEVMALGRPLVATRAGCLDEVVNSPELGRVLPQSRADLFAGAMVEMGNDVLDGKVYPERISDSFRSRFSNEVLEPKYCEMLSSLLATRGIQRD